MKKLFLGLFTFGILQICNAQTKDKSDVQFTPPVIKKDKPASKPTEKMKFTPPSIKKYEVSKNEEVKFTPPVIVKDKTNK